MRYACHPEALDEAKDAVSFYGCCHRLSLSFAPSHVSRRRFVRFPRLRRVGEISVKPTKPNMKTNSSDEPTSKSNLKIKSTFLVVIALFGLRLSAIGADHPELMAFPPAQPGMERFVIVLPHKERGEEDNFKVELIAGKTMPTDGVNFVGLGVSIEPRDLKGWGYTYYDVVGSGEITSTLIGVPPGTLPVVKFVAGSPLLIAYNSRIPIVLYVPAGYEIRYRIWSTSDEFIQADKG